jgi:hypothetical protein
MSQGARCGRRSPVDVNGHIRDLVRLTRAEARHRETAVHVELADNRPSAIDKNHYTSNRKNKR